MNQGDVSNQHENELSLAARIAVNYPFSVQEARSLLLLANYDENTVRAAADYVYSNGGTYDDVYTLLRLGWQPTSKD